MLPLNDGSIRVLLKENLANCNSRAQDTFIIEELGLRHGAARIDIAVIDTLLRGFEIKSDCDNLERLPNQIQIYNAVFDRVTLVTGHRLLDKALPTIPEWWGIKLAETSSLGRLRLIDVRDPQDNPSRDMLAITKLLWKAEALSLLEEIGAADGFHYKPRAIIYQQLAEQADPVWLCGRIRQHLCSRTEWRVASRQRSYDG